MYDKQVKKLRSAHEQYLASLRGVETLSKPVLCLLRYLATRHDECVINQRLLINVGVEDLMSEHHQYLIVNFSDVLVFGSGGSIDLSAFDLKPKVQPMPSW